MIKAALMYFSCISYSSSPCFHYHLDRLGKRLYNAMTYFRQDPSPTSPNDGVAAFNPNNDHAAYLASGCCAAWFTGDVVVTGTLSKGHSKFQIDHPLDSANKYLSLSAVESSDMKNVYDGIAVLDASGEATVELSF